MDPRLMRMRQRGVLFTFLTFIFIGVVLAAVGFYLDSQHRQSETTIEVSVLNSINAKYDDVTDDIIALNTSLGIPSIVQRILPFRYSTDQNVLVTTQTLPLATGKLALYFDVINAYRIFATDGNTQHTYDGVHVALDVPRPAAWGGAAARAHFNILPHCMQYQLIDDNTFALKSDSTLGCSSSFDLISSVQRIDVNISLLATTDDFNVVTCDFNGSVCPHESFAADANYPFLSVQWIDSNCVNCTVPPAEKNISLYFSPGDWNTIVFSCVGSTCGSDDFTLQIGNGVIFNHGNSPTYVSTRIQFRQPIASFYYQDANYTVTKPGFDTLKSNVVVFPQ